MDLQSIKNRFGIIGNSPELNYALQVAVQVANTDLTVLIIGDSGVGKEAFSCSAFFFASILACSWAEVVT